MSQKKNSFGFNKLVAILGAVGGLIILWIFVDMMMSDSPENSNRNWLDKSFPLLFLLPVFWLFKSAWQSYHEPDKSFASIFSDLRERAARKRRIAEMPPLEIPPMSEEQEFRFDHIISVMEKFGLLIPGEIDRDDILACIRSDFDGEPDLPNVLICLAYAGSIADGNQFSNLSFMTEHVEMYHEHVDEIVADLIRISGDLLPIDNFQTKRGGESNNKSIFSYSMAGLSADLEFNMPNKSLPFDVIEHLGEIVARNSDSHQLAVAQFDNNVSIFLMPKDKLEPFGHELQDPLVQYGLYWLTQIK